MTHPADTRSYGKHSPLGRTVDVPEERTPPEEYVGGHRSGCHDTPDVCDHRCPICGFHTCLCLKSDVEGWS